MFRRKGWHACFSSSSPHYLSIYRYKHIPYSRHVFYLGTKYSRVLKATYRDATNQSHAMEMGCYGLGVSRLLAATVESFHDDHGMVWPHVIAPYMAIVVPLGKTSDDEIAHGAHAVAADVSHVFGAGEVVLDDRWLERPGVKLTEAELIGYPWRLVVGRHWGTNRIVEVLHRPSMLTQKVPMSDLRTFFERHGYGQNEEDEKRTTTSYH
jgi:prolyl-tRNA synthetase